MFDQQLLLPGWCDKPIQEERRAGRDATDPIRAKLRTYVAAAIADTWHEEPRPTGTYPHFSDPPSYERQPLAALLLDADIAIRRLESADDSHCNSPTFLHRE